MRQRVASPVNQTVDQWEFINRPEVALISHMAGISNKNGLYNLLSYVWLKTRWILQTKSREIERERNSYKLRKNFEKFLEIISWNRHYQDQLLDFCIFKNGAQRSLAKSIGGFWLAYPIFYLWPQKYPDYTLGRRIPTSILISHAD